MTRNTGPQDGVRLEVWFDFAYPWCFIAERRVRRGLERASVHADAVRWGPVQLHPDVPSHAVPFLPFMQRMFGLQTIMQRAFNEVTDAGAEEGLQLRLDMIDTEVNTMDAHRLILWAVDERGNETGLSLTELLFSYRFEQGKDIGNYRYSRRLRLRLDLMKLLQPNSCSEMRSKLRSETRPRTPSSKI